MNAMHVQVKDVYRVKMWVTGSLEANNWSEVPV